MDLQRLKPATSSAFVAGLPFLRQGKKPGPPGRVRTISNIQGALHILFRRAIVLSLLVLALAASASARQLTIDKFSSEIFVNPDSSLDVTETIEAHFIGAWHGLYRTIPVEYVTPQGFNYTLFVKLDEVTDAAGQRLKVESSREGPNLKWKIYIDDATDAVRTVRVHYTARNALKFFEDHDELYWNVTGNQWDVPIGDASTQILLPSGVTGVRACKGLFNVDSSF
jgi:uncharacterized membrane protein